MKKYWNITESEERDCYCETSIQKFLEETERGVGVKGKWIGLCLAVFLLGLICVQASGRIEISGERVEVGSSEEILTVPDYDQKPGTECKEPPRTPAVQKVVKPLAQHSAVYQEKPTTPAEEPASLAVPAEEKKETAPAVPIQPAEMTTQGRFETARDSNRDGWKYWLPEEVKEGEEMTWLAGLAGILAVFLILLRKIIKDKRQDNREIEALRDGEQVSDAFLDCVIQKRAYEDIQDYLHREMQCRWGAEDYREFVEKIEADYGTIESKEFYSFHQFEDMTQLLYMAVCSKVPKVQIGFHLKPSPQGVKIHAFLFVPPQG